MQAVRLRIGKQYVKYIDTDRLDLTDDPEEAGLYSVEGAMQARALLDFHLGEDTSTKH